MEIKNLKTNQLNQNGYSKNVQTKGKIGAIYTFPADYTPDDCLSCEGYSLLIVDYQDLYRILGTKYNKSGDESGTFRIPDYNITKRFLQPGTDVGTQIAAGIPDHTHTVSAFNWDSSGVAEEGRGSPDYGHQKTLTTSKASASNAIYGKSSTVQPPSQIVHLCIKYK
ncbi:MAG: phage tail protein [Cyanobacteriota bacterium]|nr:phage tail protein [Cyanobacteriota bacterium]